MLVATQINPLIDLATLAAMVLAVLITRLHLQLVSLGIGVLWRLMVSMAVSLTPVMLLANFEGRFLEHTTPTFLLYTIGFLGVCWAILILGSRNWISRSLSSVPGWGTVFIFFAFLGVYSYCWVNFLPDVGRLPLFYYFGDTRNFILLAASVFIAERSIYVPRCAASRIGKIVSSATVIALIGLVLRDVRFFADWKNRYLLPPQVWHELRAVQNLSCWVIGTAALIFPSRFVVPYSALGFFFALNHFYGSEARIREECITIGTTAIVTWALIFSYRRCAQTSQEAPSGGLPPATQHGSH